MGNIKGVVSTALRDKVRVILTALTNLLRPNNCNIPM